MEITLLRPLWLLALIPLAALAWLAWRRRDALEGWRKAADPALLQAMVALGRVDSGAGRLPALLLSVMAVAVIAMSGPAVERRGALSFRNLDGVLFVVDVSPSVTEHDGWPGLLTMGRFGVASLGTRPAGLIVFGGDAYSAMGMTTDHLQLGQTLSLLGEAPVPDPGSRPARALALAAKHLTQADVIAGDVVLFTDGAGLDAESLRLAGQIAEQGARLSLVSMDVPTAVMQAHAAAGQGRAFAVNDSEAFSAWLAEDARTRLEQQDYPLLFWRDLGRWLLIPALIPLLLLFRREAT